MSDRNRDETFEVIDTGGRSRAWDYPADDADLPHVRDAHAPPLHLGDQAAGSGPSQPDAARPAVPAWQRWGVVIAVFIFGAVASAYVWQLRDPEPDIVAGPIEWTQGAASAPGQSFDVPLYNAGDAEIVVSGGRLPEWGGPDDDAAPRERTLQPGEWRSLTVSAKPTCSAPRPTSLTLDVVTEYGATPATIPLAPSSVIVDQVERECTGDFSGQMFGAYATESTWVESDIGGPRTQLELFSVLLIDATVTDAALSAPGIRGNVTGLTIDLNAYSRDANFDVEWQITDCAAAQQLTDVEVTIEITTEAGTTSETLQLDSNVVYPLALWTARECQA